MCMLICSGELWNEYIMRVMVVVCVVVVIMCVVDLMGLWNYV